uniref:DUF834 domain-containing protein n=1 Tax=Oryza meridionalis TaxID=40149 RepID=A0A0E0EPU4_9ORYZ
MQLETVVAARVHGGRGVSAEVCANGAVAGVRRGMAMPAVQAARRGSGYGDGSVQPELAGKRRSAGSRGEHRRGHEELGEEGETEEESTRVVFIGSGGEIMVGRGGFEAAMAGDVGDIVGEVGARFGGKNWGKVGDLVEERIAFGSLETSKVSPESSRKRLGKVFALERLKRELTP